MRTILQTALAIGFVGSMTFSTPIATKAYEVCIGICIIDSDASTDNEDRPSRYPHYHRQYRNYDSYNSYYDTTNTSVGHITNSTMTNGMAPQRNIKPSIEPMTSAEEFCASLAALAAGLILF